MAEQIATILAKESTTGVELTLTDSNGILVNSSAISSIVYTWSDGAGLPINEKDEVSIAIDNPVIIKLVPDDSFFLNTKIAYITRKLTVKWVYIDAVLGTGTIFVHEFDLKIENNVNGFLH